jgi:hypothetical protein
MAFFNGLARFLRRLYIGRDSKNRRGRATLDVMSFSSWCTLSGASHGAGDRRGWQSIDRL